MGSDRSVRRSAQEGGKTGGRGVQKKATPGKVTRTSKLNSSETMHGVQRLLGATPPSTPPNGAGRPNGYRPNREQLDRAFGIYHDEGRQSERDYERNPAEQAVQIADAGVVGHGHALPYLERI